MLKLADRCNAAGGRDAGRGSHALADRRAAPGPADRPLGRHPLILATIALNVAADHLRTWVTVMRVGPMPTYSGYTLLRGAIETAALSRWLVDPDLTPAERVARGVAALLEDYRQRRTFEAAFGSPDERTSGKSGAGRLAELITDRDTAAIPVLQVPGASDMLLRYGPVDVDDDKPRGRDWPYRVASAFAHGLSWSLLVSELGQAAMVGDAIRVGRVSVNEGLLWLVAQKSADGVELAVEDLEAYMRRR